MAFGNSDEKQIYFSSRKPTLASNDAVEGAELTVGLLFDH